MNKIRVLFVSPFTSGGGACRNMFNIISQLDSNYIKKLIVTGDEGLPHEYYGLIETESLGKTSVTGAFWPIYKSIKRFNPKYIFTTTLNTGLVCALIVKLFGLKSHVIARCTVTPSEIYHHSLKNKLLNKALKIGGNLINTIIAQTEYMRNDLMSYYGFNSDKVITIRNIVDFNHIQRQAELGTAQELNPSHYNIIAVGALYSVKGFDLLIESVSPLIQKDNRIHLYIIGEERYETNYKSYLQKLIESKGLESNISLLGQRTNPFPYYKAANLFVLSSLKEGYPNVVLEALSLQTPVVATDVVDFKDVIFDGVNGYIVKKNSVESLKEGIKKSLTLRNESIQAPQNFDFKNIFV